MRVECPYLSQFSSLKHAFFEAAPSRRREEAIKEMAGKVLPLITLTQVHGNKVLQVTGLGDNEKSGDGLVTTVKGIALGILTADCGPVLFFDPLAEVIGACHAGWRGAQGGILQATLQAMEELGAKRSQIYATLGPTIQQENYEVGPEFPEIIGGPYETYFYPSEKKGHHYFNLPFYICHQLLNEELAHVHDIEHNTFTGNYASRRRFLSQGNKDIKFDNLSAIAII